MTPAPTGREATDLAPPAPVAPGTAAVWAPAGDPAASGLARDVFRWSAVALALTTVHHVYGAVRFGTPYRLHAALLAAAALGVMASARAMYARRPTARGGALAGWVFWGVGAVVVVLVFGVVEGFYNHVVKVALYSGGAPVRVLGALFPSPPYEPPNDLAFEVTGVAQVIPTVPAAAALVGFLRARLRPTREGIAPAVHATVHRATTRTLRVVRVTGGFQVALGLALWAGHVGPGGVIVRVHMVVGVAFVLAVWALAALARRAGMGAAATIGAVAWGAGVVFVGAAHARWVPGPLHWAVRVLHVATGVAAMAIAARLAARARHGRGPRTPRASRAGAGMPNLT